MDLAPALRLNVKCTCTGIRKSAGSVTPMPPSGGEAHRFTCQPPARGGRSSSKKFSAMLGKVVVAPNYLFVPGNYLFG